MSDSTTKAEYFAFISHKSADAKYAKKMQKFIEGYKLPAKIRENSDIPKRLSPICSYEVDFSPNPLSAEMKEKLSRSKFLIVLCSEALIKNGTKYVNYEIETFIELKRAEGVDPLNRIIPIIISENPLADDTEFFPEALKALGDDCPIAINRRNCKNDKDVFFYAISGMLDIDFVALKNRDRIRKRKSQIALSFVFSLALLVTAFLAEYYIPREYHYLDFVTEYGIPVGIEELTKSEYSKTASHYVITRHKHKTVSLEYVNSSGSLTDHNSYSRADRPAKYVYDYANSALSSVTYYDRSNKPYFILQYSGGSVWAVDIKDPYMPDKPYYIGEGYESQPSALLTDHNTYFAGNISRFEYTYDENGHITKTTFHSDSTGRLANDAYVFGFEYVLDEKGRTLEKYFLDAKGERRLNSDGIYCNIFTYDENNNCIGIKNVDINGIPVADSEGMAFFQSRFDESHNQIQTDFYDENGNIAVISSYGGATQKFKRDEQGRIAEVCLYDENGNLSQLYPFCGQALTYDKNGFVKTETYIDSSKNAVANPAYNYSIKEYVNDENGNVLETLYRDEAGNLKNNSDGYARKLTEYDAYGRAVKTSYYSANGRPADFCGYGYSVVVTEYDAYGREISTAYFDSEEKPVNISGPSWEYGYHKVETLYEYGTNTKISFVYYDKNYVKVNSRSEALGETYASAVIYVQGGEITSLASYRADGTQYAESYDVEVEYSPKAEKITTTTHRNEASEIVMTVKSTDYVNGVEKSSLLTEYQNGIIATTVYLAYSESGILTSKESITYDIAGNELVKYKITYDNSGNPVLQESWDHTSETYYYATESTFEGKQLTKTSAVGKDVDNNVLFTSLTDYTKEGEIFTQNSYKDGILKGRVTFEYDKNDNLLRTTNESYRDSGLLLIKSITTYVDDKPKNVKYYHYDESGNLIAENEINYDSEGNVASE